MGLEKPTKFFDITQFQLLIMLNELMYTYYWGQFTRFFDKIIILAINFLIFMRVFIEKLKLKLLFWLQKLRPHVD